MDHGSTSLKGEKGSMTEVELTESTMIVHVRGADQFWALKSQLEIPLLHVVGAQVDPAVGEHWGDLVKLTSKPLHVSSCTHAGALPVGAGVC
jgi:hypothetical protein